MDPVTIAMIAAVGVLLVAKRQQPAAPAAAPQPASEWSSGFYPEPPRPAAPPEILQLVGQAKTAAGIATTIAAGAKTVAGALGIGSEAAGGSAAAAAAGTAATDAGISSGAGYVGAETAVVGEAGAAPVGVVAVAGPAAIVAISAFIGWNAYQLLFGGPDYGTPIPAPFATNGGLEISRDKYIVAYWPAGVNGSPFFEDPNSQTSRGHGGLVYVPRTLVTQDQVIGQRETGGGKVKYLDFKWGTIATDASNPGAGTGDIPFILETTPPPGAIVVTGSPADSPAGLSAVFDSSDGGSGYVAQWRWSEPEQVWRRCPTPPPWLPQPTDPCPPPEGWTMQVVWDDVSQAYVNKLAPPPEPSPPIVQPPPPPAPPPPPSFGSGGGGGGGLRSLL